MTAALSLRSAAICSAVHDCTRAHAHIRLWGDKLVHERAHFAVTFAESINRCHASHDLAEYGAPASLGRVDNQRCPALWPWQCRIGAGRKQLLDKGIGHCALQLAHSQPKCRGTILQGGSSLQRT
jgi:hypothetical protein